MGSESLTLNWELNFKLNELVNKQNQRYLLI